VNVLANLVLLVAVSLAWACGYVFVAAADRQTPPVTATAVTALIAAVVMIGAVVAMRRPMMDQLRYRAWVPIAMGFTAVALPRLSVVVAERSVAAGLASVLGTTVPILTLLLTTFVTKQTSYSSLRIVGAAVATAGLVVFVGLRGILSQESELLGIAIMVSGGVIFTANGIFVSYQSKDLDEAVLSAWTMLFGAIALTAMAFVVEEPLQALRAHDLWSLIGEGTIGMGFAYLGYYMLVARSGAYFASIYAFLVPPFGVVASFIAFGEPLTLRHLAGVVVVLLGLALMMRRQKAETTGATLQESGATSTHDAR
jgi:drug/metabolite transporter (DMT)-like permease